MKSHAIMMDRAGPPEVLTWRSVELPPLRPDEVRLRTLAAAVNHSDLEIRAGTWPLLPESPFPYVPGLEAVGEIVGIGSDVSGLVVGQRAWTMMQGLGGVRAERPGGYAEHVTVAASALAPLPDELDPVEFAAVGLAGVTAYQGLAQIGPLDQRRLVVTGAGGGVGSAAVALAKMQGAWVLAVASRPEQQAYLAELGADEVVVARAAEPLRAALPERSVDAVFDTVAGPLFPVLVKALRHSGRLSVVGAMAGNDAVFDVWDLLLGITLTGYSTEDLDGAALREATRVLVDGLRARRLRVPARTLVPIREASRAHAMLERHEVSGRIVLVPEAG
ncbi:quinone oxidoreductase family protein [Hyalangium versicolor]|uniref:quinone oxidoreductase family protein n=1 Tax=Hyalangium versicolor TaxID=2861190 RepID=UPI001CCBF592|nr:zinc-binding alcohol dehydrogenase family protein [Hyalangium versicolor]